MDWFWAFVFTQVVEIPIYVYGFRVRVYEAFGASALTHPIVWFVIPTLWERFYLAVFAPHPSLWISQTPRYWIMVVIAETFAVTAEAGYFRFIGKKKTLGWAFAANMASVTLGFASRALFDWP
ncbi:MAG TPA: hypothetical protein VM694_05680 [Polyangium sp.]|nr:hypothetical protein [Polyangium sp.]